MHRIVCLTALALAVSGVSAGTALAASSPSVTNQSASHIGDTSVQLNADVNPNGAATTYFFQIGLTTAYSADTKPGNAGHGTKFVPVHAAIGGLLPGTVYHYHVIALNSHGEAAGPDHSFKTKGNPPPEPTTLPATNISTDSATMNGTINPNNQVTGYEFQWGNSTAYGSQTPSPPAAVSGGSSPVSVSQSLVGILKPGTWFHYRLVAFHNNTPLEVGADQAFLTEPSPRPKPHVSASTTPHRIRHKPFSFTTSGMITGPSWIPSAYDCGGTVAVRFWLGKRNVKTTLITVAPNCAFAGTTTFNHKPGKGAKNRTVVLRVTVYFRGNGYLAGRFAKTRRITLG